MSSNNSRKRPDPPGASPPSRKEKSQTSPIGKRQQSSLLRFFASSKSAREREKDKPSDPPDSAECSTKKSPNSACANTASEHNSEEGKYHLRPDRQPPHSEPIIPHSVAPDKSARWKIAENNALWIRTVPSESISKAASFDLDGTLLHWRIAGWPSKFEHYELWNASVITKIRSLYDNDGYKLIIFTNQGAIRSALSGKKANFVKSLLEWLISEINRPVHVLMSCDKKKGFHKPNPGMWDMCEQHCNGGQPFSIHESFFVGDSVIGDGDAQGGVDERFAQNVGASRKGTLQFYSPERYFGPSGISQRKKTGVMQAYRKPPVSALVARTALIGGYLEGPLLLLLAGVQGSGKSTFCQNLLQVSTTNEGSSNWLHLSQDTIKNGKPGKREQVEEQTRQAIRSGMSVVVDRMHLDQDQRAYFVAIAKDCQVPVHCVFLHPLKSVVEKRVRERKNHPGGVEGEEGARIAVASLERVIMPTYDEGFDLISLAGLNDCNVKWLCGLYGKIMLENRKGTVLPCFQFSDDLRMPSLALGTMGIGKRKAEDVVSSARKLGWKAVDTAPTYNNELQIGKGISNDTFIIVKVPKKVTNPDQVRLELRNSLSNLGKRKADLLLLHWPSDVIESGTLHSVWEAMEQCKESGLCRALGVCNFSVDALRYLLPHCKIAPSVNQVERHPFLPQIELLDFCMNNNILVQAHTALAQGSVDLLQHETISEIANECGLSCAQVILNWNLQQGVAVVSKSVSEVHLQQAIRLYAEDHLKPHHMKQLNSIKQKRRFVSPFFMNKSDALYEWKKDAE